MSGSLDRNLHPSAENVGLGRYVENTSALAFYMPLEKSLAYIENDPTLATLSAEDYAAIDRLALPLREGLAALAPYRDQPCHLQQQQMTLDFRGNTMLCCGIYDADKYGVGDFLETPLAELQLRKESDAMCARCKASNHHVYGDYSKPELQAVALRTVLKHYAGYLNDTPAVGQPDTLRLNVG